ncbi:hypothetical protein ABT034_19555 [Streptomyces sp. NPDC002773]|uniref:hypothetical protein n=1 Tax=Streptomyces sp. NPDC002773 TaxID=3154430 RepID=UPI00331A4552
MGWTHDYADTTARNRRSASGPGPRDGGGPPDSGGSHAVQEASHTVREAGMSGMRQGEAPGGQDVGISRILRRRARWVSARLRHPRDTP